MRPSVEGLLARCSGSDPQQMPWALWRHFPREEFLEPAFSEATIGFHRRWDFHLWKIGPRSSYAIRDHGARDEFRGDPLGRPAYLNRVIQHPSDWRWLRVLDPRTGWQGGVLRSAATIAAAAPAGTPVLMTVFSPMTQAKNLCGAEALADHWTHARSDLVHGLELLAESTRRFVRALADLPIHGLFYAIQECGDPVIGPGYADVCAALDGSILREIPQALNLVHLHGRVADFDAFTRYPAAILHWDEGAAGIPLEVGSDRFDGIVSGGIAWPDSDGGDVAETVRSRRDQVLARMAGRRFLLSASCVIPWQATDAAIEACRPGGPHSPA